MVTVRGERGRVIGHFHSLGRLRLPGEFSFVKDAKPAQRMEFLRSTRRHESVVSNRLMVVAVVVLSCLSARAQPGDPHDVATKLARSTTSLLVVVSDESPTREHVARARAEALTRPTSGSFATGWSTLTTHFPHLTTAGPAPLPDTLAARLTAQRALHLNGSFAASDQELDEALELAARSPELLTDTEHFDALIAAIATGFDGMRVRRLVSQAEALLARVATRWPFASLKPNAYPSAFHEAWGAARRAALSNTGWLAVSTLPIERERLGGCALHVNGPRVATLPLGAPLTLPTGHHLIQVRCGHLASWLQTIEVKSHATSTARVPLDAMSVTRPDPETESLVLVAPAPGDLESLIIGLSDMTGIQDIRVARIVGRSVALHLYDPQTGSPIPTDQHAHTATSPAREVPIALIASGAALMLGGIGFHVWSEEASDRGAEASAWAMADPESARIRYREAVSDYELRRALAFTGYGVGGALIVAGIVVWLVDDAGPATALWRPWFSKEGGGFVWQQDF